MQRLQVGILALALLCVAGLANAGRYDQEQAKDNSFAISWKSQNNEILYDTVCEDLGKGSVKYRNCRREAQKLFREKCRESDDKSGKYCIAVHRYYPL
jgi:hypothetical protein